MQGIVKDDKGAYVKSAIVRLLKISDAVGESEEEAVTYAETDEDGKFVIGDLGPDERYIIEVHIEIPEPVVKKDEPVEIDEPEPEPEPEAEPELEEEPEPEDEPEREDPEDESDRESESDFTGGIIDSRSFGSTIDDTIKMNLSVNSLYNVGFDPKDKSYLTKNNMW